MILSSLRAVKHERMYIEPYVPINIPTQIVSTPLLRASVGKKGAKRDVLMFIKNCMKHRTVIIRFIVR